MFFRNFHIIKMHRLLYFALILNAVTTPLGATCTNPKVTVTSFSTEDATILTHLAHVGELIVECDNGASPILFAELPCGRIVPVARIDEKRYQISWIEEIKKGSSGSVIVRLFDEEGYSNIRKAQRDGDKVVSIKSLADIVMATHKAYKGPWVNSELVAALVVGCVAYFALTTKSKVQA